MMKLVILVDVLFSTVFPSDYIKVVILQYKAIIHFSILIFDILQH